MSSAPHPFYPPEIKLIGYTENSLGLASLFAGFTTGALAILGSTIVIVRKWKPSLCWRDQMLVLWFVLSGTIHCFFEGYFVLNHQRMPLMQDFFGQLWKEYAKSDSRYMTFDPLVLSVESITIIIWGPLSFLTAWFIVTNSAYRYPVQALVSTGHFYGDLLYYMTSLLDSYYRGLSSSRPEPLYFWGYFVFMNMFWLVIPGFCLYSSVRASAEAVISLRRYESSGSREGLVKEHMQ